MLGMLDLARWILLSIHLLVSAGWFGAMAYNLLIQYPRARRFFGDDAQFESFTATLARGARWKVLGALGVIGLTGALLIPLSRTDVRARQFNAILLAKLFLWFLAIAIFWRVTWRLWPRRIFATEDELPAIRRAFRNSAIALVTIAAAATILGAALHAF